MPVKPHAADPATDYENVDQGMMSRVSHDQYVYGADKNTLWHILHDALKDHPSYTSIRSFTRTQNGRAAYISPALKKIGGISKSYSPRRSIGQPKYCLIYKR